MQCSDRAARAPSSWPRGSVFRPHFQTGASWRKAAALRRSDFAGRIEMNHRFGQLRQWTFLAALGWLGVFLCLNFQPTSRAMTAIRRIQNQQSLIEQGGKLFNPTCSSAYCHGANGANGSAPRLGGRNFTVEYLTRVVSEGVPGTPMPAFKNQYSPEQIRQLVAYVMSLPKDAAAPATTANDNASAEAAAAAARAARRSGPEDQATTALPM